MLRKSLEKLKRDNVGSVFFIRGDGSILPFNKESFDVVFMGNRIR